MKADPQYTDHPEPMKHHWLVTERKLLKLPIPFKGQTGLPFIKDERVLQTLLDPRSFISDEDLKQPPPPEQPIQSDGIEVKQPEPKDARVEESGEVDLEEESEQGDTEDESEQDDPEGSGDEEKPDEVDLEEEPQPQNSDASDEEIAEQDDGSDESEKDDPEQVDTVEEDEQVDTVEEDDVENVDEPEIEVQENQGVEEKMDVDKLQEEATPPQSMTDVFLFPLSLSFFFLSEILIFRST